MIISITNHGDGQDLLIDGTFRVASGKSAKFEISATGHLRVQEVTPLAANTSEDPGQLAFIPAKLIEDGPAVDTPVEVKA